MRAGAVSSATSPLVVAAALAFTALLSFSLGAVWIGGQAKLTHSLRKRLERVPKCASHDPQHQSHTRRATMRHNPCVIPART